MPRDLPIGNGHLLATFDLDARIRDLYYPHVGQENHAQGMPWRTGVWVDGRFAWVDGQEWDLRRNYVADALVTDVTAEHSQLPVQLRFNEVVDHEENVLVRRVRVQNLSEGPIRVRLFFHADVSAYGTEIGDTVFYDPKNAALVHYKGSRYFMLGCATESALGVTHFATGNKRRGLMEGTWRDAEDGALSGNPIAQGAVDSVTGVHLDLMPGGTSFAHYWVAAGRTYQEAERLHRLVTELGVDRLIQRNIDYWRHWISAADRDFGGLPAAVTDQFKRSLLILRTHVDHAGGVIAANDSDIRQFNADTYSYVWPRDGAVVSGVLDRAGFGGLSRRFLEFCADRVASYNYSAGILSESGFLMHKYNPDGSVGSSWHPWIEDDVVQLPIQEDETALVVSAIWHHYVVHRDLEAARALYHPFVERAADFLLSFRDERTGLPRPSYDLWEERRGVFTFTAAAVAAGLLAAAALADLFQDGDRSNAYHKGAEEVKAALERHLYCPREGRFARGIVWERGVPRRDVTVDSSLLGPVFLGTHEAADPLMVSTARAVEECLWVPGPVGGLARYEGDRYHQVAAEPDRPGNPWVVCTLWLAQYRIAAARDGAGLAKALDLLLWAAARALPSGVLPEQIHPGTGGALSVSPLTWSHATLVAAVLDYLERYAALGQAGAVNPGLREVRFAG
jgi:glucoamylase